MNKFHMKLVLLSLLARAVEPGAVIAKTLPPNLQGIVHDHE